MGFVQISIEAHAVKLLLVCHMDLLAGQEITEFITYHSHIRIRQTILNIIKN